ncbi:MAG: acetaldehyde dehydrogenase (acetylating) [Desulfitibacter sp. BRH_c19]|nr:MAG: acetaldehyde dehydrogenase (acetylating) [Desulfitibacter sp. BRH_c19]
MKNKVKVAILGPGNIGTDLMFKITKSRYMELEYVVGIQETEGLKLARKREIKTTSNGIKDILGINDIKIVFDATSAKAHSMHADLLGAAGIFTIDLTPAAIGAYCVPSINFDYAILNDDNVNMVTCGGQATIPIVAAINSVADVSYAEIVASLSSKSAGPGTRQNIDEFTQTTKKAIEKIAGADLAKAIIILNPAEPPILMKNTIYTIVKKPDIEIIKESVKKMVAQINEYVPGYRVVMGPILSVDKITTMIEVEGSGDFLPSYSGNLDIMTCAAVQVGEKYASKLLGVKK